MNLDGEPIWSPIKENDLKFAVNTNWDLFQYAPTNTLYLRNNDSWLKATDVKGPWSPAGKLPASFAKLPAEENWKDVKANLPGKAIAATAVPKVFVSLQPAELILLTGRAGISSRAGDRAAMGEQHRKRRVPDGHDGSGVLPGRRPVVHGGRLHRAVDVRDADLARRLQEDSDRARALARARVCPGTDQAIEAVLLAEIPQTARVNKKELKAPDVAFQGDPKFTPIEKTTVERAVNTDKDVFKIGDLYYMCYQGVWFVGKGAVRPLGGRRLGAGADLSDPRQLAGLSRHLRHDRGRQ